MPANEEEVRNPREIIKTYEALLGQQIKPEKLELGFRGNVQSEDRD